MKEINLGILIANFALFCYAYATPNPTESYSNKRILVEPNIYILYWNFTNTDIIFEIHAKTSGWLGFGISPNGGMENSNVILTWINSDKTVHFTERNTKAGLVVPAINNKQMWTPLLTKSEDGYIISKSTRKLKIFDVSGEHLDIDNGTPHVIFAWSNNFVNNDASYHGFNRSSKTLPLTSSLNLKVELDMSQVEITDFRVNVNQ